MAGPGETVVTSWPPHFSPAQQAHLTRQAASYALSHGLLYLPVHSPNGTDDPASIDPSPASAIHAPLSLIPAPFPRHLFSEAQRLQRLYNILYTRVALDHAFLDRVMGAEEGVGLVDTFTGTLWKGWKTLRDEGIEDKLHLGLFRSDYLLNQDESGELGLKQVEFNTISSSFGALSEKVAGMHRYLFDSTTYFGTSDLLNSASLPPNTTTSGLVTGLLAAHYAANRPSSRILFVVQPRERNIFDQLGLEHTLLAHGVRVVRQTLAQLASSASLTSDRTLLISLPYLESSPVEISTIYFRAAYTPNDFPTSEHYQTRFLLERSTAVKCPSIPLQLAGGKKVQQVLSRPNVLERFTNDWSSADRDLIRVSWVEMWGLDDEADAPSLDASGLPPLSNINDGITGDSAGVLRAREQYADLVLKPQREGGGNNVYRDHIPAFLDSLPASERAAWIAMRLIRPPPREGLLVRSGQGDGAVRLGVISELGIFGWALFGKSTEIRDGESGWLVRTKGTDEDEGGVAAGFSVLDSLMLTE